MKTILRTSIRMYYRSRTDGCCCIRAGLTLRRHTPDGSTFMTSWPPHDVISIIGLRQSMRIYLKSNRAKFYANGI